jgi:hypothetical protein
LHWLSTPLENEDRGHRQGKGVASSDDIHTPVEKPEKKRDQQEKRDDSAAKPPGQFVTDDLEEQTARFIEAVKSLARRRREREAGETWGPPPGSGRNHRSRRR